MTAPTPGIYLLLIRLKKACRMRYGRRDGTFAAGYYGYVGSAMGGLTGRLQRHLSTATSRGHWHVDALLQAGDVCDIQIRMTSDRADECATAELVKNWPGAGALPGFGCSDCRCQSHLFHFHRRPLQSLLAGMVEADIPRIFDLLRTRYTNHAAFDRDPFQTLIKCILSLRTQDPVTDAAADRLFRELRTPPEFAAADPGTIAKTIFPVGMYRQKARRLTEIATVIMERFDGAVPADIDALLTLPGVGRKTANLVRSFAFHRPAVCVDTHVHRISNRWGLVRTATPDQTEAELRRILPRQYWQEINAFLVQHGQQICRPVRPDCGNCPLQTYCRYDCLVQEAELLAPLYGAPAHPTLKRLARTA